MRRTTYAKSLSLSLSRRFVISCVSDMRKYVETVASRVECCVCCCAGPPEPAAVLRKIFKRLNCVIDLYVVSAAAASGLYQE